MIDPRIKEYCAAPAVSPALNIAQWRLDHDTQRVQRGGELVAVQALQDSAITARDGHAIPIRIYAPVGLTNQSPVVLYAHGGGWVIGSIAGSDSVARAIAHHLNAVVVTVDYRLAPEHPFPAANNDMEDVYLGLLAQPGSFAWQQRQFVFAGDSAGAHLAMLLAYRLIDVARDQPQFKTASAVLAFYPCLDPSCSSPTMQSYAVDHGLTQAGMNWYWQQFIGVVKPTADHTPWLRTDLSDLCPTWIVTAQYDVLRSEAEQFALRLMQAGVTTSLSMQPGMLHGFVGWQGVVPHAAKAIAEGSDWVKAHLSLNDAL